MVEKRWWKVFSAIVGHGSYFFHVIFSQQASSSYLFALESCPGMSFVQSSFEPQLRFHVLHTPPIFCVILILRPWISLFSSSGDRGQRKRSETQSHRGRSEEERDALGQSQPEAQAMISAFLIDDTCHEVEKYFSLCRFPLFSTVGFRASVSTAECRDGF
jgi:hypothetical protein